MSGVTDYIMGLPEAVQDIALTIRQCIRNAAPGSGEAIRYGIPAFQIGGRTFLYFAVWKRHVGLYPIYKGDEAFEAEIAPFRDQKNTVRLQLAEPIPLALIEKIVASQLSQLPGRQAR